MEKDDKIINLEIVGSKLDVEVKKVLNGMMEEDEVIVVGVKNGKLTVATSSGKLNQIILRLEQAKLFLLRNYSDTDY